ncbi:methyltransferase domain-containing protein [Candidatus Woesearchaeota archaeon]|nr:methyltransferase domain-containing protein [Candidatus Woesearchaeota archaeon]
MVQFLSQKQEYLDNFRKSVIRSYSSPEEVRLYQEELERGLSRTEKAACRRYLKPGDAVLDIGCGAGREAMQITDICSRLDCIDLSFPMAAAARNNLDGRATVLNCDCTSLPYADGSYDAVLMFNKVLSLVPGKEGRMKALAEANRVLKPDGYLIAEVVEANFTESLLRPISPILFFDFQVGDKIINSMHYRTTSTGIYVHSFTGNEILSATSGAGFRFERRLESILDWLMGTESVLVFRKMHDNHQKMNENQR